MKKTLFLLSLLLGVFIWNICFAQSADAQSIDSQSADTTGTSTTVTGTSTPAVTIDYRYNALLEFFLQKTQEKDYQTTYSYMAGNFPKLYALEDFTMIVNALGLTEFTDKKWTAYDDKIKEIGVATVTGEFTMPDQSIRKITFYIIIGGETEVKIGAITETLQIADLAKRFPKAEELTKLIQKDLKSLAGFIKKNQAKPLLKYLSKLGQTRTKITKIRKVMRPFRKLNMTLPKKAILALIDGTPTLNEYGLMVVQGSYQNNKNRIDFTLAYDYEWQWKLGGFTLTATPLSKLTGAPAGTQQAGTSTPNGTSTPATPSQ